MLVNKKNSNTSRVKFISYTGEYPNLCSGVLTLEIDGKEYKFGHNFLTYHYDKKPRLGFIQMKTHKTPILIHFGHLVGVFHMMKIGIGKLSTMNGRLM